MTSGQLDEDRPERTTCIEYSVTAPDNPRTTTNGETGMNTTSAESKPPTWYWVVSGLAVLWMLFGVMAWVMDLMTDEASLAELSEAQRQLYAARPQWLFAVYGVAIFSGLAGAIGLLMLVPPVRTLVRVGVGNAVLRRYPSVSATITRVRVVRPGDVVPGEVIDPNDPGRPGLPGSKG